MLVGYIPYNWPERKQRDYLSRLARTSARENLLAVLVGDDAAVVNAERCIGCGVCVTKCDKFKAIVLRERKIFRPPADNMAEAFARRYFELKGRQDNLVPKLTLGVTRFLSSVNPIHVTGPRAMSFKKD